MQEGDEDRPESSTMGPLIAEAQKLLAAYPGWEAERVGDEAASARAAQLVMDTLKQTAAEGSENVQQAQEVVRERSVCHVYMYATAA